MSSAAYRDLSSLLGDPTADPQRIWEAALALTITFVERPQMIGLLPPDCGDVAMRGLQRAGEAGISDAWFALAGLYLLPEVDVPVPDSVRRYEALEAYQRAERHGVENCSLPIAKLAYDLDIGDLADEAWLRVGALQGESPEDPAINLLVGYMLQQGFGVTTDADGAGQHFRRAAEAGSADAAFELGLRYYQGIGEVRDEKKGTAWTFHAAELGSNRAMHNLGAAYATGRYGLRWDEGEAVYWYEKAAEAGHAKAALNAGLMLMIGDGGLEVDRERGTVLLRRAEELLGPGSTVVSDKAAQLGFEWRPRRRR